MTDVSVGKVIAPNLRGKRVVFMYRGRRAVGEVITRIRDTRWLVMSRAFIWDERGDGSRRRVMERCEFEVVE